MNNRILARNSEFDSKFKEIMAAATPWTVVKNVVSIIIWKKKISIPSTALAEIYERKMCKAAEAIA